ncbi:MAG: response regulator [Candidatus Omnitrophica bacterium]|nr:response regulator [Candidatus Omnitrophota bacterium]
MTGKKILIADDEPDVLSILEKKLRYNGFEVLALSKGKDINDKVKEFKPDLLILDIVMPDMDGYAVGILLRKDNDTKATPIIFMTGKELEFSGMIKRAQELGRCDFINKPCTFDDLLQKVKEAIG